METKNIVFISIAGIVMIALIVFLVRRNREDIKTINPDATNSVEETHTDQERSRDKI